MQYSMVSIGAGYINVCIHRYIRLGFRTCGHNITERDYKIRFTPK